MTKCPNPGNKVHYYPTHRNGIVKSYSDDPRFCFVVFNCNDDWDNYKDYTAQFTPIKDLILNLRNDICDSCPNHNCIDCDIPSITPEDCEYCSKSAEEDGIEYEANFTYKDNLWYCDNCNKPV